jgi:cysteine desulfurase family protein
MIYLDSAATSFYRPDTVAEAVAEAIRTMGNGSRGSHEAALASARVIFETRQLLSELFHGPGPEQVAFTANSTESLNIAIKGLIKPGQKVITTVLEHNSVLRPLYELESRGVELEIIGCIKDEDGSCKRGRLDYEALREKIVPGVRAVVMTHASNLTGNRTDIRKVGQWCHEAGTLFILDASQTAGVFPIDMEADHVDVVCFTGHKGLMGPQGTGGLCVGKNIEIEPLLSGGSGIMTFSKTHPRVMPTALEAGTLNGHGIAGLQAALRYIRSQGLAQIHAREREVMEHFYMLVKEIPGVTVYGDFDTMERAAIVSLNLGDEDSGEVSDYLAEEYGIYTRPGGHCAPLMHQTLGTVDQGAVRFSFSSFNTKEDAEQAVKALKDY